jgi:energy-coupling factor transporter ATP-binding protein EcfA2
MAMPMATSASNGIARVSIEGLFGLYTYDIALRGDSGEPADVSILYGDNGSGKTTILNTIFHLLSAANDRGHRGALSRIPFRRAAVTLIDGSVIAAGRGTELRGSYTLSITRPGIPDVSGVYKARPEHPGPGFESEQFEQAFVSAMQGFDIVVYMLSDDRRIESDALPRDEDNRDDLTIARTLRLHLRDAVERDVRVRMHARSALTRTIELTQEWIRDQAIRGSNVGSESANAIYRDIVKRLAHAYSSTPKESGSVISDRVRELTTRNAEFSRYGFVPPLNIEDLLDSLEKASPENRSLIERVIEPYLNGLTARLDGLMATQRLTDVFISSLNRFFGNKKIEFTLSSGFQFIAPGGARLDPEWLSSGERHLLLLFCYTLLSRMRPSIFIIDEPELSLNIKWQRMLIGALRELVSGSANQFIFATHSLEILAPHRNSVFNLTSAPSRK